MFQRIGGMLVGTCVDGRKRESKKVKREQGSERRTITLGRQDAKEERRGQ